MENSLLPEKREFFKWGFVFSLLIVSTLFFVFGAGFLLEVPERSNFCEDPQVRIIPVKKDECLAMGGQWVEERFVQEGLPDPNRIQPPKIQKQSDGYCNPDYTCSQAYEEVRRAYEKKYFIVLLVLGLLAIFASFTVCKREALSEGFLLGGVLTLTIAVARYWPLMTDGLRVALLGIVLLVLVWVGFKKFKS